MKINATYEDGRLRFSTPLSLKHSRVDVVVDIPDSEIEPLQLDEVSRRLIAELDAIRNAPIPAEWDAEVTTKADRLDAFAHYRDV